LSCRTHRNDGRRQGVPPTPRHRHEARDRKSFAVKGRDGADAVGHAAIRTSCGMRWGRCTTAVSFSYPRAMLATSCCGAGCSVGDVSSLMGASTSRPRQLVGTSGFKGRELDCHIGSLPCPSRTCSSSPCHRSGHDPARSTSACGSACGGSVNPAVSRPTQKAGSLSCFGTEP
jgi:hypothetical protein